MKVKKRMTSIICCLAMIFSLITAMSACGGNSFKITFNYNYDGAPDNLVLTVESGKLIILPDDPKRVNFEFIGWFTDKEATREATSYLEYGVKADATYYAGWKATSATVTFDPNYDEKTGTASSVTIGSTVSQPSDPVRNGYLFLGWYKDKAGTVEYQFNSAVNGDLILYAKWEINDGDTVKVRFQYNYDDSGTYYSTEIKTGRRVVQPANPTRSGYSFIGWYSDAACTTEFNFANQLQSDVYIYAYWLKPWVFEAEYTDVSDIEGRGYSGEFTGTDIILRDSKNLKSSNNFYVSYLYSQWIELIFEINAEKEVCNAVLELSLSAEQADVTISPDIYTIKVNDTVITYDAIPLTGVAGTENKMLPFAKYRISMQVNLNAGSNVIKLITSNNIPMRGPAGETLGTMYATAPVVDCLYLYTNVTLTWTAGKCYEDNIKNK